MLLWVFTLLFCIPYDDRQVLVGCFKDFLCTKYF